MFKLSIKESYMRYVVITFKIKAELEDYIKRLLSEGWKPLGGVSWCDNMYAQAMIKDSEWQQD